MTTMKLTLGATEQRFVTRRAAIFLTGVTAIAPCKFARAADLPVITVAADPSFKPFAYMDPNSRQMEGFDMDLMRALGSIAGYQIKVLPLNFAGIIPALQSHSVDAAASSITITDARKKVVNFSDPYYDSGLQMLVRENSADVSSVDDVKNKTVGALTGSTGYDFVKQSLGNNVKLVPYSSFADAVLALIAGSVDAVVSDQPVVAGYAAHAGKGKAKVVGPLYAAQQYGIAFPLGSELVKPTNNALRELKANGTYATLYKKWFDVDPPQVNSQPK